MDFLPGALHAASKRAFTSGSGGFLTLFMLRLKFCNSAFRSLVERPSSTVDLDCSSGLFAWYLPLSCANAAAAVDPDLADPCGCGVAG